MILAETYVELVTNIPHWLFEATSDVVFGLIGLLFGRFWLKRHDRNHHEAPGTPVSVEMVAEMVRFQMSLHEIRRHHN